MINYRNQIQFYITKLCNDPVFRLIVLSSILYTGNKYPQISVIIGLVFIICMNMISENEIKESFEQIEQFQNLDLNNL